MMQLSRAPIKRHPVWIPFLLTLSLLLSPTLPVFADNLVPNFGFEDACSTTTGACLWSNSVGTTSRNTVTVHSGSASLLAAGSFQGQAQSVCFRIQPGATYTPSFWYNVPTGSPVHGVAMQVNVYPTTDCSGRGSAGYVNAAASTGNDDLFADDAWHLSAERIPFMVGSNMHSAYILISVTNFFPVQPGTATAYFDDLSLDGLAPTAVTLAQFKASSTWNGVTLYWQTLQETDILGFNVWRFAGERQGMRGNSAEASGASAAFRLDNGVKVNDSLIPAQMAGSPNGASYTTFDADAAHGTHRSYQLEIVHLDGTSSWSVLASVTMPQVRFLPKL